METKHTTPIVKQPTFSNFITYTNLPINNLFYTDYEQRTKLDTPYNFIQKTAILGIELEIENLYLDEISSQNNDLYWNIVEDGSLRNYGKEFCSIPLRAKQIPYAIECLIKYLRDFSPEYTFTSRCSTHIHLNIRDFTEERLFIFLLLYCLFEKHFFKIAGTKRESSIFCVPLYKTNKLNITIRQDRYWRSWNKYLALNLCPIEGGDGSKRLGTIEFRHLYGTLNPTILYNWINNILHLRKASLNWEKNTLLTLIQSLNTTSEYYNLYKQIFGNLCLNLTQDDFESCISYVKTALWGHIGLEKHPGNNVSWMFNQEPNQKATIVLDTNTPNGNSTSINTTTTSTDNSIYLEIENMFNNTQPIVFPTEDNS